MGERTLEEMAAYMYGLLLEWYHVLSAEDAPSLSLLAKIRDRLEELGITGEMVYEERVKGS